MMEFQRGNTPPPIRVAIVDDHAMLVEGLSKAIDESGIANVEDTFMDISGCRRGFAFVQPDILLLDISLPDGSGVDFCKEITEKYPSIKVIAITSHNEYSVARQMLDNGASGYILKNASSEEVIEGIEAVYRGEKYLCDDIERLIKRRSTNDIFLTVSEKKVLKLIVEGLTNPEIAEKLFLSPLTVKGYRKSLLLKLDVKNTAALVRMAIEEKLIDY